MFEKNERAIWDNEGAQIIPKGTKGCAIFQFLLRSYPKAFHCETGRQVENIIKLTRKNKKQLQSLSILPKSYGSKIFI